MFLQSKGLLVTLLSLAVDSALAATSASSYLNNTISLSYGGGLGLGPGYLNLTALQQIYSSSGGSIAIGPYSLNITSPNGTVINANLGPSLIAAPTLFYAGATVPASAYCYGCASNSPMTYNQTWSPSDNTWWKYVLYGKIPVHVIYFHNNDLPPNVTSLVGSFLSGVGSTVWFNTLKNFYNTGYIPGATNTNYGGPPQYVSGIYEKTHDFFDCAWLSGPGRQCRQLLNVTDIQNIIMTVENDRTAFPNSPYPDGNQVVAFFLSPSIAESFSASSGLAMGVGYCGYHGSFWNTWNNDYYRIWIKFTVTGISSSTSRPACLLTGASLNTPNTPFIDNAIMIFAHELAEAITNPNPPSLNSCYSWCDAQGNEVGDKCQGAIVDLVSGSNHNTVIGSNKFILPSIYDRVSKQCTGTNSTKAPAVVTTDSNGYCSICSSSGNAALFGGQQLNSLSSANRITASGYTLTMQTDGNLVLKNSTGFAIFASNTWQGNGPYSMTLNMQIDGNLVMYNSGGSPIWNTYSGDKSTTLSKYCMALVNVGITPNIQVLDSSCTALWDMNAGTSTLSPNQPCGGASWCSYGLNGVTVAY